MDQKWISDMGGKFTQPGDRADDSRMSTRARPKNHRELREAAEHTVTTIYRDDPVIARFECTCGWSHEGNPLPNGQTQILDEMVAEMTVYDHAERGHWYLIHINGNWYANTGGGTGLVSRATAQWLDAGMP